MGPHSELAQQRLDAKAAFEADLMREFGCTKGPSGSTIVKAVCDERRGGRSTLSVECEDGSRATAELFPEGWRWVPASPRSRPWSPGLWRNLLSAK